jgi:peroxiredoxin
VEESDSVVLGISVDSFVANKKFADEIGVKFPLLSDFTRKVSKEYGILDDERQFARRTTFVVDKQGVIQHIDAGRGAIDPTGAIQMCSALKKKEASQ